MGKWRRRDDWIGSQVEDSFVMIDLETGTYVDLNKTAAFSWELLAEPHDENEIVDALCDHYDVDRDHCRSAVAAMLADMAQKRLIDAVA